MTGHADIVDALNQRLKSFTWNDPDTGEAISGADDATPRRIAWAGVEFAAAPRRSWLRPTYLPTAPESQLFGWPKRAVLRGMYVVDVFRPETWGEMAVFALADAVAAHFGGAGSRAYLPAGDSLVNIETEPAVDAARVDGGWRTAPVRIEFFAHVPWRTA